MNLTELKAESIDVAVYRVESADACEGRPAYIPASHDLAFKLVKAAEGVYAQYAVPPRLQGPRQTDDAATTSAAQEALPACQLSALISELIASANHLAHLSSRFPAMAPSDAELICAQAVQALLAKLKRSSDAVSETASRKSSVRNCVENYVKRNLSSKTITPDLIYRQLEIPRSTLYKAFAETGGVAKYIQDQRLDVARSLLLHPEEHRSLSQIADSLGFKTSARFSKAFRRRFGSSPRQMRKVSSGLSIERSL